jgi:hypothetical protein
MKTHRLSTILSICLGLSMILTSCDSSDPAAVDDNERPGLTYRSGSVDLAQSEDAVVASKRTPSPKITDGQLDGNDHPATVLVVMDVNGGPAFLCSATLLSPTVVLTAGHCASNFPAPNYTGVRIFTESDVNNGTSNFPFGGGDHTYEAASWTAHPDYPTTAFFVNDVGVLVLETPVPGVTEFGVLPEVDQLDAFKTRRGLQDVTFTSVGYGVQLINPVHFQNDQIRMNARPRLLQINVPGFTGDFSMLLSNNHSTGGTCFGDSGGPNFLGESNVVAAVTSFGINGNCAGTGGVFRMDRQNVLDFVNSFLP